jgi:hypothetical protein
MAGGEALAADFDFGGAAPFAFLRVRVLNFSSAVYVLSLNLRLTVSPNYNIPANSFLLLNFPASHSNDKYPGTIP